MQLEAAIREAVLGEIRSALGSTFSDISDVVKRHPEISGITLGQLFGGKGSAGKSGMGTAEASGGEVNTRTGAGRKAYKNSVAGVLESAGGPVTAEHVRNQVGGTGPQARKALNQLIEDGKATFTGKARGTKYEAT